MKKQHILFSNYHWENDEYGKDHYDYAREEIWENDEEHRFTDEDYTSEQLRIEGLETFTCPICGEEFETLEDAKECCRDEKWETMDDIPDDEVSRMVYDREEWDWGDFKAEFSKFIKDSPYGFLMTGYVGTWRGNADGGCYVNEFDDLYKFWEHCDYIKVYDEGGHLYLEASHHDGNNYAQLKELTKAGSDYKDEHYWDDDQDVHTRLWNSTYYTRLPHYAHRVWGMQERSLNVDEFKLEAAIQFGRISVLAQMYEDKDIEEIREIFESHWKNFESNLSWGYFADYYQDQVNQHKLYGEE